MRTYRVALAVGMAVGLMACGGDDDTTSSNADTETTEAPPASETTDPDAEETDATEPGVTEATEPEDEDLDGEDGSRTEDEAGWEEWCEAVRTDLANELADLEANVAATRALFEQLVTLTPPGTVLPTVLSTVLAEMEGQPAEVAGPVFGVILDQQVLGTADDHCAPPG